jgi:hypothetical protein
MTNPLENLSTGWWSFSLPGYRDHPQPTTYSLFSYEDLPPINVPGDANWSWLEAQPLQEEWSLKENSYPDGSETDLTHLKRLIAQAEFELPAQFTAFMASPSLHERIRSCTACMLELGDFIVRTTDPPGGLIIQFLVDQQGVLRWYLYADAAGGQAVLVSGEVFGLIYDPDQVRRDEINLFNEEFWLCASSFEEFICRFWLENEIWFRLDKGLPLDERQQAYLDHYR